MQGKRYQRLANDLAIAQWAQQIADDELARRREARVHLEDEVAPEERVFVPAGPGHLERVAERLEDLLAGLGGESGTPWIGSELRHENLSKSA